MGFWHIYMGLYGGGETVVISGAGKTIAGEISGRYAVAAQVAVSVVTAGEVA